MDKYEILTSERSAWHAYSIYELAPDGSGTGRCVQESTWRFLSQEQAQKAAEMYIKNHLMPDKW